MVGRKLYTRSIREKSIKEELAVVPGHSRLAWMYKVSITTHNTRSKAKPRKRRDHTQKALPYKNAVAQCRRASPYYI